MKTLSIEYGRKLAQRQYPVLGVCVKCGDTGKLRHHKDGNTHHNEESNIMVLCSSCHRGEHRSNTWGFKNIYPYHKGARDILLKQKCRQKDLKARGLEGMPEHLIGI